VSKQHGTVIICRRINGDTHAWEEPDLSEMLPEGYFVEIWSKPWPGATKADIVRKGTFIEGYLSGMHSDAGEAVRWCWQDRKRRHKAVC
jgi:hypothetical protein